MDPCCLLTSRDLSHKCVSEWPSTVWSMSCVVRTVRTVPASVTQVHHKMRDFCYMRNSQTKYSLILERKLTIQSLPSTVTKIPSI